MRVEKQFFYRYGYIKRQKDVYIKKTIHHAAKSKYKDAVSF